MPSSNVSPEAAILIELVHDLRQYLGNIETSVYCLNLNTDPTQSRAQSYLCTIEQQVARAESRLSDASKAMGRLRAQPAETPEILALTKSSTSVLT
jgi:hypothetical protein